MTPQDIEKLKALCEKQGFEIKESHEGQTFFIKKKDEWEGVEFVQSNWSKTIYPVNQIINFKPCNDEYTPSTESAYVEQLKAKAKELYGEIRKGDVFDQSPFNEDKGKFKVEKDQSKFTYDNWSDSFYVNGVTLYRGGKWAKKVEEPIRVIISAYDLCHSNDMRIRFSINKQRSKSFDWDNEELKNHIEESIEAFLNRKP